jgi:hypothetical protein
MKVNTNERLEKPGERLKAACGKILNGKSLFV